MSAAEKGRESEKQQSLFILSPETSPVVDEQEVDGPLMNHIQQLRRTTCLRGFALKYVRCVCLAFIASAILYCYWFVAIPTTGNLMAERMDVDDDIESIRYTAPPTLKHRIFHLDLKGAAPRVEYYAKLFPMLHQLNFTDILMEYEDMFPYDASLSVLKRRTAYTEAQVKHIQQLASMNNLHIVPLVQTFGHMEFVLKYPEFQALREVSLLDDTICPSDTSSIALIREMLTQIRKLHPQSKIIHIGADEAWHIARDQRCVDRLRRELGNSTSRLKLSHIATVARIAKEDLAFGKVWAWNDMFDDMSIHQMNEFELGRLLVPVVWGYVNNVIRAGYFPDGLFYRLSVVGFNFLFER